VLDTQSEQTAATIETISEVLETMAFVSLQPVDDAGEAPASLCQLTIDFEGPIRGRLVVMAPEALGTLLAANMLGTAPDDADAIASARDVLKELLNIACGTLLRKLTSPGTRFHVSLPHLEECDPEKWNAGASSGELILLDAEGQRFSVCLENLG
jgi:CheY-specific phosphatase CheX